MSATVASSAAPEVARIVWPLQMRIPLVRSVLASAVHDRRSRMSLPSRAKQPAPVSRIEAPDDTWLEHPRAAKVKAMHAMFRSIMFGLLFSGPGGIHAGVGSSVNPTAKFLANARCRAPTTPPRLNGTCIATATVAFPPKAKCRPTIGRHFLLARVQIAYSNPAPRAHLYLAPSTSTGSSVE
ncbi:hypothetical protein V1289_008196 [Bradyrhizobium sp. AZCC 2289]